MPRRIIAGPDAPRALLLAALCVIFLLVAAPAAAADRVAHSIELTGTVDPATERWLSEALDDAREDGAALAIVRVDTPGGLDESMRSMVKDIIAAPFPVVVYVSPDGARAASAGLFVTQAGDVAAMAPQTNIGSATPIQLGGGEQDEVLGRKVRNDAAAYVRALAEGHGRDGDLAERMVRDAANVTSARAERSGLVDLVAADERRLLRELDGFRVRGPKARALETSGVRLERRDMPFQYEALQLLVNPTIAFLLLLVGLAGIAFEAFSPGAIAPGVLGGIALVLGLIGTALLPVTVAGVILLLAALAFFVAETQIASHGVLGLAGVVALVASGLLLFDTDSEVFEVSVPVAIAAGAMLGGFTLFAVSKAVSARHAPVRTGWEELVGDVGTVRVPLDPLGQVFIEGALWRARAAGGARLEPGERVRVDSVEGLTLNVRPADAESEASREGD
jgi:membrane-bound serine protease (ClpP class)